MQRNLNLYISRKGIAWPHSQFPHFCVCERSYNPTFGPPIFLQQNRQTDQRNIKIAYRNMNIGIWTVAAQFLSWEYLCRIFGIVSLHCSNKQSADLYKVLEHLIKFRLLRLLNSPFLHKLKIETGSPENLSKAWTLRSPDCRAQCLKSPCQSLEVQNSRLV
jgi:hypothetical protein